MNELVQPREVVEVARELVPPACEGARLADRLP